MKKLLIMHIPFLLLAPILCSLSAVISYPQVIMGARAAILGLSIASTVTAINIFNRQKLSDSQSPSILSIVISGLISGTIAGIVISFLPLELWHRADQMTEKEDLVFLPPHVSTIYAAIAVSCLYNILVVLGYRLRFVFKDSETESKIGNLIAFILHIPLLDFEGDFGKSIVHGIFRKRPNFFSAIGVLIASSISYTAMLLLSGEKIYPGNELFVKFLLQVLLFYLLTYLVILPFAMLFFASAAIADPAFSYKRWRKRTGQKEHAEAVNSNNEA
ncbi:MAG TPA: hypothetical protein DCZ94_15200 [Lentisphaeria bacterium]|nr:MAG: hypothetical protein A2X48_14105 [Lentisphaerae bacterium GWF2_49_21]HBC88297.1 hypothetical protein [Lentisphaeria bacterium]